jgi:hypothetical protein
MSDQAVFPSSFREHWRWLRPAGEPPADGLLRAWPDLGPAGRSALLSLLAEARRRLEEQAVPEAAPMEAGRLALARRLLDREEAALAHPPARGEVVALVADTLESDLEADPARCLERLRRLDELSRPLFGPEAPPLGGDGEEGRAAVQRLRALAAHLGHRLPRMPGGEADPALGSLEELACRVEELPPVPPPAGPDRWAEIGTEGGWELAPLLQRIEEELGRVRREVARRALLLRQRFLGSAEAPGGDLPWILAQLALDPPRAEHWRWLHQRLVGELARHLDRLGLAAGRLAVRLSPGLSPDQPDPACDGSGAALGLADLSLLAPEELASFLESCGHALLPLLVAREGLPGRAWRLAAAREEGGDPARDVVAVLLRPADLEAWARWAGDWALQAGWQAGDLRVRLCQARREELDWLLARVDLERRLGSRGEEEIRERLCREAALSARAGEAAWRRLVREPGSQAAAALRLLHFREAGRRWRRAHRQAGSADWFHLLAACAPFPLAWLRQHLHQLPPPGLAWRPQPPALVKPVTPRGEGLLSEMEERLAALGRIRREDLEAGREFDGAPAGPPTADPPGRDGSEEEVDASAE